MNDYSILTYLNLIQNLTLKQLKGVLGHEVKEEIKNILESLGLLSQRNDLMYRLAKWQRRVLCVAMSLIGDAPVNTHDILFQNIINFRNCTFTARM